MIGVPHPDFGEAVVGGRRRAAGRRARRAAAIIAALDERLARFKQPKRVFVVDELPRNAMGKVQKNVLRDRFRDLYREADGSTRAPIEAKPVS